MAVYLEDPYRTPYVVFLLVLIVIQVSNTTYACSLCCKKPTRFLKAQVFQQSLMVAFLGCRLSRPWLGDERTNLLVTTVGDTAFNLCGLITILLSLFRLQIMNTGGQWYNPKMILLMRWGTVLFFCATAVPALVLKAIPLFMENLPPSAHKWPNREIPILYAAFSFYCLAGDSWVSIGMYLRLDYLRRTLSSGTTAPSPLYIHTKRILVGLLMFIWITAPFFLLPIIISMEKGAETMIRALVWFCVVMHMTFVLLYLENVRLLMDRIAGHQSIIKPPSALAAPVMTAMADSDVSFHKC